MGNPYTVRIFIADSEFDSRKNTLRRNKVWNPLILKLQKAGQDIGNYVLYVLLKIEINK
jgi:hypothetical protein